ncbi:TlpA family protein disulfide reductase [Arenibacter algicola]|uniref:TlpA family protein disulfide reductase n=1 Tax=Arenibacter algicola TaxID=616991 RepID=UPI001C06A225|nr:TlpA disulfide reductase family protein [Arenibacter algicola]MBU2903892.1 TlpA family protein disulfide reductase [Arenibacter algicola]
MKKVIYLICLIGVNVFGQESDSSILEKTVSKIYEIETVKYQSTFQAMDSGTTYSDRTDTIFFDFRSSTFNSTPKYHLTSSDAELIYDGKRHIQSLVNEKVILTNESPNANNPLLLTIYSVKKLLPKLMTNDSILIKRKNDTIINNKSVYVFNFKYRNGRINWDKFITESVHGASSEITLMISISDYLPRKMIMDNGPTGTMSRTYDNFDFEYVPRAVVWTGELLPENYSKMTFTQYYEIKKKEMQSLKGRSTESKAIKDIKQWELPNLEDDSMVDVSKLRGNVILLEFWFKNCGPCVQAVPKLNAIHEKYKHGKFRLFGIEYREDFPQENLMAYIEKIKMAYPTLYKGGSLAATYEVTAAPTFVLISKKGDVVYAESGFNEKEIIKLIEANL